MKWAVFLALAACEGTTGTLNVALTTAPGSNLIAEIDRIRLTLTNPDLSFEATRTADGLDLAFEIDAVEDSGAIYIEGFDANDARIVVGQSPPFPLAGGDGHVVIYVAPPFSILQAPEVGTDNADPTHCPSTHADVLPARSHIGATTLLYGAALAGGLDEAGAPSADMRIYNIYDHTTACGQDMLVRRADVTLAANDANAVYIFGGVDEGAAATSTLHRFQANIAPAGAYSDFGSHPGLESARARAIKLGPDSFFVTGLQPALLGASTIVPISTLAGVPPTATAATTADHAPIAAFLREDSVGFYNLDGVAGDVSLPPEPDRAIVSGGVAGTVVVVGGATREAHLVTIASLSETPLDNVLSVPRRSPTVAATSRHILVANGFDENGAVIATADILDATTLELIITIPLEPRANAIALAMPNDQILIAGGDEPTRLVELFTPPVPTDPAPP